MKKTMKRLLATMMAVCLAATVFAGCQKGETSSTASGDNTSKTESGTSSEKKDVVTIQFYGGGANPNNTYYEWQQEYFADKIGVRVEAQVADKEKIQPMLSAGNLPDLGYYAIDGDPSQAILGGHVLDLTDKLDKIPNWAEKFPESVNVSKNVKSAGTGKVYGVIRQIGVYNSFPLNVGCYAANIRWDVYEKAGKPKVTDMYSYLEALKKMQDVYPKTEEGLPTFGLSLFPEWDSTELSCYKRYSTVMGVMEQNMGYNVYSILEDKVYPMIEKGSPYYEALKWLNTANRMGLLDPDSATQTYANQQAKVKDSGQSLSSMWGSYCDGYNTEARVNGENPQGYMPLIWEGQHPVVAKETKIGDERTPIFVSSTTKYVDECLAFINLMFDEDACLNMYGGPEGELWEIKDGKYTLTDAAFEYQKSGTYTFASTGETTSDWWSAWGLQSATKHSKYGVEFSLGSQVAYAENQIKDNKIVDMYEKVYDTRRPIEVWEKNDALCYNPEWKKFVAQMPSDITDIQNNVKGVIVEESWKIVMNAKSDAEVDSMFDAMKTKADELGLQTIVEWGQKEIENARKTATDLGIKD